ncbi:MAG: tRNA-(ms[2]io[6]A)-hydroxylase [Synechococcaceae cyanobacterium]|nr:tRNA-(ms[2]io[6]A)-hydroxylase [Synechococcaceae cyanobacterium]
MSAASTAAELALEPGAVGAPATRACDEPDSAATAAPEPWQPPGEPAVGGPRSGVARVRWLAAPSSRAWLEQALARPELVLLDHAHCERKAAGAALQLMFRYPCEAGLAERLSPLAREELEHFERVLALLSRRGLALRPLPAPDYGARLSRSVRRDEPGRMLDSFLVAGLIEARSHERMALLAAHSPDPALAALYGDLLASEARHFGLYWYLAEERFGRPATVQRLQTLAAVEAEALTGVLGRPEDVRMHSPGVEAAGATVTSA